MQERGEAGFRCRDDVRGSAIRRSDKDSSLFQLCAGGGEYSAKGEAMDFRLLFAALKGQLCGEPFTPLQWPR
jgi:hypothetical protein